jgi:hypothetical protein
MPVIKIKILLPNGCGMNGNQHTEPYRAGCRNLARS